MSTSTRELLDPRNDFVFKKLFEQNPDLLRDLISAVRVGRPPIDSIEILNPGIPPEAIEGKAIVLDILACDSAGRRFNREMQMQQHQAVPLRMVFYLARMAGDQLQAGDEYTSLKPVVGIYLLDFALMPEHPDQAAWTFELRDRRQPNVVLPDAPMELNVIELPKADRLGQNGGSPVESAPGNAAESARSAWIKFFKHAKEPAIMSQIDHPPVREAYSALQDISQDELTQLQALARTRALMDQRAMISEARAEGIAEGRAEGIAEGRAVGVAQGRAEGRDEGIAEGTTQGSANVLIRLLALRFGELPAGVAERIRAGTEADHLRWTERVLTAPSLDAVLE